jgi:hypothetical protein
MTQHPFTAFANHRLFPQSRSRSHAPNASGCCLKGLGQPSPPRNPHVRPRTRPESKACDPSVWPQVAPAASTARALSPKPDPSLPRLPPWEDFKRRPQSVSVEILHNGPHRNSFTRAAVHPNLKCCGADRRSGHWCIVQRMIDYNVGVWAKRPSMALGANVASCPNRSLAIPLNAAVQLSHRGHSFILQHFVNRKDSIRTLWAFANVAATA